MLYDNYVVKMKKLVKLRNAIIKYRFLILAFMFLCIAGVSTFLFSIGKINILTDCQSQIVYGENIDFQAKAFLKDVTYEYSSGNGKWTTSLPTTPGTHKVRAVSRGFLGSAKYSEAQVFKILPRETTLYINGYNFYYGDEILLSGGLVSGDVAKIIGFTTEISEVGKQIVPSDVVCCCSADSSFGCGASSAGGGDR